MPKRTNVPTPQAPRISNSGIPHTSPQQGANPQAGKKNLIHIYALVCSGGAVVLLVVLIVLFSSERAKDTPVGHDEEQGGWLDASRWGVDDVVDPTVSELESANEEEEDGRTEEERSAARFQVQIEQLTLLAEGNPALLAKLSSDADLTKLMRMAEMKLRLDEISGGNELEPHERGLFKSLVRLNDTLKKGDPNPPGALVAKTGEDNGSGRKPTFSRPTFVPQEDVKAHSNRTPPKSSDTQVVRMQSYPTPVEEVADYPFVDLNRFQYLKTGDPLADWGSEREWRSSDGKSTLKARVVSVGADTAVLRFPDKSERTVQIAAFSSADQQFFTEWKEVSRYFDLSPRPGIIRGVIAAEIFDGTFAKEGKVHETRNFRFECDEPLHADTVRDFSRLFEVTFNAVSAIPLSLATDKPEGGKFLVRLFAEKEAYLKAGGKEDAAGIYIIPKRTVLVPLTSLGLNRTAHGTFRKAGDFDPATLIHETTHAVTHQWLGNMPMWFIEGLAEYVAAIPYRDGEMNLRGIERGLRARAEKKLEGATEIQRIIMRNRVAGNGKMKRLFPLAAKDFVTLGQLEFMGKEPFRETPIILKPVQPYQIRFVDPEENRGIPQEYIVTNEFVGGKAPPQTRVVRFIGPDPNLPLVIQRYVSSMLLVDHFLEKNPAALRCYLFSFLHQEWERHRYLERYEQTAKAHDQNVRSQIAQFQSQLDARNARIQEYNRMVDRHNAGIPVTMPQRPGPVPAVPDPVPVPEILAQPRGARELSSSWIRTLAIHKFLKLPNQLAVPGE